MNIRDKIDGWLLKKSCLQLHVPHVTAFLDIELTLDGKILTHQHKASKSFVRNAYNHMFSTMAGFSRTDGTFGDGYLNAKDKDGAVLTETTYPLVAYWTLDAAGWGYMRLGGVVTSGIVVGTGTGAESIEDYKLGAIINPGNATGQLYTVASQAPVDSYASSTLTRTYVSYFNNNSGSTIVLGECGLIISVATGWNSVRNFLMSRDLVSPTVNVLDKAQLKITYTINLVYP